MREKIGGPDRIWTNDQQIMSLALHLAELRAQQFYSYIAIPNQI